MSATALFNETITPVKGNDTFTLPFPRRFYGRTMRVMIYDDTPPAPEPAPQPAKKPLPLTRENYPGLPRFTKEQVEALGKSPRMKKLRALFSNISTEVFPPDVTMKDVREMRLKEKYGARHGF